MRNLTLTVSTLHINFILNFYINRKRQEDWATLVNHCCWPLGPDKFPSPSRDNTINHPHKLFIWRKLYKIADGQQQASWTFYYSEVFIWRKNIVAGCWWKCWNTTRGGDNNSSTDINYMEQGPTSRHYILHPHTHQHPDQYLHRGPANSVSGGQRRSYVGLWLSSAWTKEK